MGRRKFSTRVDLNEINRRVRAFAEARDWQQFHSPKNLSMALSVEVAELMEHFQWLTEAQSADLPPDVLAQVRDEIADIQVYLVRLADRLEIDILAAVETKMVENERKYPAGRVRGSARKYSAYEPD
jgi:NTP pyrophosphatase (non-canonical NTP hydrolase)